MIIAEIGQNFMGSMDLAKELISLAKENGADLAKFQLYDHNILYKDHPEIPDVALSFEQAKVLFDYGQKVGIEVFFSVFDVERVRWCEKIGVKRYKIACGMRDREVWKAISRTGKGVIVSYNTIETFPYGVLATMIYCPSGYPSSKPDFQLNDVRYSGLSDHFVGLDIAKIALARGASIIEKHFAIDHKTGIDALWSMTPDELRELARFGKVVRWVL